MIWLVSMVLLTSQGVKKQTTLGSKVAISSSLEKAKKGKVKENDSFT